MKIVPIPNAAMPRHAFGGSAEARHRKRHGNVTTPMQKVARKEMVLRTKPTHPNASEMLEGRRSAKKNLLSSKDEMLASESFGEKNDTKRESTLKPSKDGMLVPPASIAK